MEKMKNMITGKPLAWMLSYLYFTSYVTRINFAAIIQEVITDMGYEKSALSIVLVCLSVSYGVGQIINGRIGDKIKPQNLILTGLVIATCANILFPIFVSSIPVMCVLWAINGFAQAMLWPPIVKIMVSTMDEATYSSSVVIVSLGSSVGTIFVYLTAPLIISLFTWEVVMFSAAAFGLISALVWFFIKNRCYDGEQKCDTGDGKPEKKSFKMPREAVFPFILIAFAIVLQGMIRDGVTSWMPTYLSENFGFESDKSILLTVSLAIFSIVTFYLAGLIYRRFFKNEVSCATVIYAFTAVCGLLLFLLFNVGGAAFAVVMMAVITGGMHGVNLMLISHVPKRFRKYGNISTMSGLVNSFTYIGAAIATYGVAKIAEVYDWRVTVAVWAGVLTLGTVLCVIAISKWKKFIEK